MAKESLNDFQHMKPSAFPRTIVSFDGGGTRGLFSAKFFEILESNCKILEYISTFAGTSTGSIIAIALALEIPPKYIVRFYLDNMIKIFPERSFDKTKKIYEKVSAVPHYDSDTLKSELIKVLSKYDVAEDAILGSCQKHVIVVTHRSSDKRNVTFDSENDDYINTPIIDVIMSSCSAPYYFKAYEASDGYEYMDGGIVSNNPAQQAIESLVSTGKEPGLINLLSLGTGTTQQDILTYAKEFVGHPVSYTEEITSAVFEAQNQKIEDYCTTTLDRNRYLRINPIYKENIKLDDTKNSDYLIAKAKAEFLSRRADIGKWVTTVKSLPEVLYERV